MISPRQPPARSQDAINHKIYDSESVVAAFSAANAGLFPAEETIYRAIAPFVRDKAILDIGVGGGRTTAHFLHLSSNYRAIDYSHEMVAACRQRYPGVTFEQADAREMGVFANETFDLIVFSFNGLDYVNHEDRQRVMAEVFRLVKPGGLFWFSAHNLCCRPAKPWHHTQYSWRMHPRAVLGNIYHGMSNLRNYLRNRRLIVEGTEHAVLIDDAHQFRLLTYYVTPHEQVRQLLAQGFESPRIFHHYGNESSLDDSSLRQSVHVHYVAAKPLRG